ncbi:MAG: ABC transporter ATP-binding protein/permease [Clostridiales bacterium]|nr:ABC transporter ATP-binding protein/permease [Clostridiales bacterium]
MKNKKELKTTFLSSESLATLRYRIKDGSIREVMDDWKWIFSYSRKHRWAIAVFVILGVVTTSMGLVSAVVSKYLIDIITGFKREKLWVLLTVMIISSLTSIILSGLVSRIGVKISLKIGNDIRADIFDKIIDADWLELSKFRSGDILNRFNGDIAVVSRNAVGWLPTIITSLYQFVATFVILARYDLTMAFLALLSAPFVMIFSRFIVRKQREYGKRQREASSDMLAFEAESFYHFDTIKAFGLMDSYSKQMREQQENFKEVTLEHNLFTVKTNFLLSLVSAAAYLVSFVYCLFKLWSNAITYGTMTLFLSQSAALGGAFGKVLGIVPDFLSASVSAHRVRELTELPRELHLSSPEIGGELLEKGLTVRMSNIRYAYSDGVPVLERADFIAGPGEIVAIIGSSGEGKTTMIRLLLGLLHPTDGIVSLGLSDGSELMANADTRVLIAYVPQGNTLLSGSVADNLRLVKPDATGEQMWSALEAACAKEFVSELDGGLDYMIGERGKGLSEGQCQRIAIARALLKDAPVLLLDEATSALDLPTEEKILRNILTGRHGRTVIVSTHRTGALSRCSRVYRISGTGLEEMTAESVADHK